MCLSHIYIFCYLNVVIVNIERILKEFYIDYYIFRPTAITWWKDMKMSIDIGIIGTECGSIILINLSNGHQMGITYVTGSISSLYICQNENEAAFLLITSKFQQQWRLSLEQRMYNFLHNLENKELQRNVNSNSTIYDNTEESVPNKSKLRELKQLSVEKLAIFKQKLIDTKNQTLGESSQCHGKSMYEYILRMQIVRRFLNSQK